MFDAVVLAGGSARRLGGTDKPALDVGGRSLLDRVLGATEGAATTVVVGPDVPTSRPVRFVREEPPGGGPAAALAAGLPLVSADVVVVVAADLPFLSAEVVQGLAGSAPAVLVDDDGREQWLCGAWPTALLREAVRGDLHGSPVRRLLEPLRPTRLRGGRGWFDVDTPDDLQRARDLA